MSADRRYIEAEEKFKEFAFEALASVFSSREEFEAYYAGIEGEDSKNTFLRVSAYYLFLVKKGEWRVAVDGVDQVIEYFSVSYKLVALFSLIESLSTESFMDFYGWLQATKRSDVFPITDNERLAGLYDAYKASFGSTRKCVAFFEGLPTLRQQQLCNAIEIDRRPLADIKKLAHFLYELRSGFVHEGRLVHAVSGGAVMFKQGNKFVHARLALEPLLLAFEEGVVAHFQRRT